MICCSSKPNSKLKQSKLTPSQTRECYSIFSRFSSDKETLSFSEFKQTMGVLGLDDNDFVISRIFDLAKGSSTASRLSFQGYCDYLYFLNNSTTKQRMEYCFNIFDIDSKGFISKDDYLRVMNSYYYYYTSLTEKPVCDLGPTLEAIFNKIERDPKSHGINFEVFLREMRDNPDMNDFFNILNDNLHKDTQFTITSTQINDIKEANLSLRDIQMALANKTSLKSESELLISREFSVEINKANHPDFSNKEAFQDLPSYLITDESFPEETEFSNEEPQVQFYDCSNFFTSSQKILLESNNLNPSDCLLVSNKGELVSQLFKAEKLLATVLKDYIETKQERREPIHLSKTSKFEVNLQDFENFGLKELSTKNLVSIGNRNVELALAMMTGITKAVNSIKDTNHIYTFKGGNMSHKEVNEFKFQKQSTDRMIQCKFTDFAPKLFFNLRKMYGISNKDYLKSLGTENFLSNLIFPRDKSLKGLGSFGKSGSFFFFSYDEKFVIKTISKDEFTFFLNILPNYYNHMHYNEDTLLQRFFGFHTLDFDNKCIPIVVMNNIFCSDLEINIKYDLKGSSFNRISRKGEDYSNYDYSEPLKDLDFVERKEKIDLDSELREKIVRTATKDSEFLSSQGINDYSLLIGIHNSQRENGVNFIYTLINETKTKFQRRKSNFTVREPFYDRANGGIYNKDKTRLFFFGIIDPLTHFG